MEAMKTVKECKKKGYQGISVILNGAIAIFINGFIVQAGILGWIFAIVGIVIELIAIVVDPEKADSFADVMDKAIFLLFWDTCLVDYITSCNRITYLDLLAFLKTRERKKVLLDN